MSPPSPPPAVVVAVPAAPPRPLLFEIWAEARAIVRMYLDPRYRISWFGRMGPLVILVLILTTGWWFPLAYIPFVGSWFVKIVDLVLAYVLCKFLGHEARKYRQTSPDLPAGLRL